MFIHFIILISALIISSIAVSQYRTTHNVLINSTPTISYWGAILTFAFLIYFGANRTEYIDTQAYLTEYYRLNTGFSTAINALFNTENGGFVFIITLIKTIFGPEFRIYLCVLLILHLLGYIVLFKNYSVDYFFTAFLFITSMEYTMTLNALRQTTAVVLVLLACNWFFKRKTIRFILIVLLATTIHLTSVIWIPVYFFVHEKPWSRKMILFFIGIATAVLFIDSFTNILDNITTGTEYEGYLAMFEDDDGVNVLRVMFFATTPILAFIKRRELKDAPSYINVCINLSAVSSSIYLVGMFTSGILIGRLPFYFTAFNWVLIPYLLRNKEDGNNVIIKMAICILYFAYFVFNITMTTCGVYVSSFLGIYDYGY